MRAYFKPGSMTTVTTCDTCGDDRDVNAYTTLVVVFPDEHLQIGNDHYFCGHIRTVEEEKLWCTYCHHILTDENSTVRDLHVWVCGVCGLEYDPMNEYDYDDDAAHRAAQECCK